MYRCVLGWDNSFESFNPKNAQMAIEFALMNVKIDNLSMPSIHLCFERLKLTAMIKLLIHTVILTHWAKNTSVKFKPGMDCLRAGVCFDWFNKSKAKPKMTRLLVYLSAVTFSGDESISWLSPMICANNTELDPITTPAENLKRLVIFLMLAKVKIMVLFGPGLNASK